MSYVIADIAATLKDARERKGLSQRALSTQAGVPQGQISRIENGEVDLRVSSLIALARALELELTLVPRKALSAVNAIIRTGASGGESSGASRAEWSRWLNAVNALVHEQPQNTEYAQMLRYLRDLQHFPLPESDYHELRSRFRKLIRLLKTRRDEGGEPVQPNLLLQYLQQLRNKLAYAPVPATEDAVRPAYSLDGDDHG